MSHRPGVKCNDPTETKCSCVRITQSWEAKAFTMLLEVLSYWFYVLCKIENATPRNTARRVACEHIVQAKGEMGLKAWIKSKGLYSVQRQVSRSLEPSPHGYQPRLKSVVYFPFETKSSTLLLASMVFSSAHTAAPCVIPRVCFHASRTRALI